MIPGMNFRRLVTTILLTAVTVVLTATPAAAHAELIASTPAQGASVAAAPTEVRLTFSDAVTPAPNVVEVTGPAGAQWVVGTPTVAGADVTVPVEASGPAGAYTLTYRVVSADGDPVSGSVRFTLTADATAPTSSSPTSSSPSPSPTTEPAPDSESSAAPVQNTAESDTEDGSGVPAWVWILGGALLVAAGIAAALRLTRSVGTRQPPGDL
jgi:copper resistance protein C